MIIKLNKQTKNLTLNKVQKSLRLNQNKHVISLRQVGRRGVQGEPGAIQSVVAGTGIIVDNTDPANPIVSAPTAGNDKNFTYNFNSQSSFTVNHNLDKYPSVTIFDSSGDEVEGQVDHLNVNSLKIDFSAPFSGVITLN